MTWEASAGRSAARTSGDDEEEEEEEEDEEEEEKEEEEEEAVEEVSALRSDCPLFDRLPCFEVKLGALLGSRGSLGSLVPSPPFPSSGSPAVSGPMRTIRGPPENERERERERERAKGIRVSSGRGNPKGPLNDACRRISPPSSSSSPLSLLSPSLPLSRSFSVHPCLSALLYPPISFSTRPLYSRRPYSRRTRSIADFLNYFLAVIMQGDNVAN